MSWYYAEAGRQVGPVEDAALDDLVRRGVVRDDTLVWREGMANWMPHGSARPPQPAAAAPPPAAAPAGGSEMRYCSECGRPFPAYELSMAGNASVCAGCRPVVMQRSAPAQPFAYAQAPQYAQPGAYPAAGARRYGGFWIRFLARIIDGIIVACGSFIIQLPLRILLGIGGAGLVVSRDPGAAIAALPLIMGAIGISFFVQMAIAIIYEVYFVSTRGATPGKMALGLKIIRADGGPLSAAQATGRYFAMWVSNLTFLIGYIIAGFDTEKRSLHDRICDTRVVYGR